MSGIIDGTKGAHGLWGLGGGTTTGGFVVMTGGGWVVKGYIADMKALSVVERDEFNPEENPLRVQRSGMG
jgi:hypothetical protein